MAHKTLHLHLSSMRKTAFKPIYYKKFFGCTEDLVRDDDNRVGLGLRRWNGWRCFAFRANHAAGRLGREPRAGHKWPGMWLNPTTVPPRLGGPVALAAAAEAHDAATAAAASVAAAAAAAAAAFHKFPAAESQRRRRSCRRCCCNTPCRTAASSGSCACASISSTSTGAGSR
jgi:hypothetical protein